MSENIACSILGKISYKSIGKVKNKCKKAVSSVNYEMCMYLMYGTINE